MEDDRHGLAPWPEPPLILCIATAEVMPPSAAAVESHLATCGHHAGITASEAAAVGKELAAAFSHVATDNNSFQLSFRRTEPFAPIRIGTAKIPCVDAMCCSLCPKVCVNRDYARKHLAKHQEGDGEPARMQACQAQVVMWGRKELLLRSGIRNSRAG